MTDGRMDEIDIAGLRIAFERHGRGPPLVLLHGVLVDRRHWRRQIDDLSADFTVIAWDAPGHGRSADPPETWRTTDFVGCLAAFIDAIGVERPHVMGLSWGGGLALALYGQRPDLPRTLVLAAAYAGWAGSLPADEVARRRETCLREADMPAGEFVPNWLPSLLTERAPAALVDEVAEMMGEFHPAGYRAVVRSFADTDLRGMLGTIAVPTLLLYGAEDRRSPVSVAEDLHARIPGSALVVLPQAGHLANMEAPGPFNRAVREFLRGVEPSEVPA
jgi:pimeloyl-ACP methyl ester carboxylesterase